MPAPPTAFADCTMEAAMGYVRRRRRVLPTFGGPTRSLHHILACQSRDAGVVPPGNVDATWLIAIEVSLRLFGHQI
ncbi:unnamed protein product [Soboliphyme baturini]|uniref:Transposase n=1 Tax=Soboliphyme baturini TaxID=241478 RepID=A0A183INH9_9BILA|nr:unnamed protein product [Soboliphyme baturini]